MILIFLSLPGVVFNKNIDFITETTQTDSWNPITAVLLQMRVISSLFCIGNREDIDWSVAFSIAKSKILQLIMVFFGLVIDIMQSLWHLMGGCAGAVSPLVPRQRPISRYSVARPRTKA